MATIRCRWTQTDQETALAEGWAIFNSVEIQKDDDSPRFRTDGAAIAFAFRQALSGSTLHARAIILHFSMLTW